MGKVKRKKETMKRKVEKNFNDFLSPHFKMKKILKYDVV